MAHRTATVRVHQLPKEQYEAIPIPERTTTDGRVIWKEFDNITFFKPEERDYAHGPRAYIELVSYSGEDDHVLWIGE